MKSLRNIFLGMASVVGLAAWPVSVLAQSAYINPDLVVAPAAATDLGYAAAGGLRLVLGILGLMCLIRAIWGAFLFATHGGNEEHYAAAKETVQHSVIGGIVFLVLAAGTKPAVGLALGLINRLMTDA